MGNRTRECLFSVGALLGALNGCSSSGDDDAFSLATTEQLLASQFDAGSLIIPMDNRSQDRGMLRAYGLVYRLLSRDIPVHWAITPSKSQNGADVSVSARNLETGAALGAVAYRGGPFLIDAKDRDAALPLINAWLAEDCETVVHEAVAPFTAEGTRVMTSAPRLAVARDRYQSIAFANFNAAGIPDSTGAPWSEASPDLLSQTALVGASTDSATDGALWNSDGGPKYCHLTFTYYWPGSRTPGVVQEIRAWLASGNFTHLFAQAESLRTIENDVNGKFLTTGGVMDDGYTPYTTATWQPSHPIAQFDGSFRGTPDWMDSIGLADGSEFRIGTDRLIGHSTAVSTNSRLLLMTGTLDGDANNGRATYLAGFNYGINLPMSTHPLTNGVRILLNSVIASECNLQANQPVVRLEYAAPATVAGDQVTFTLDYGNDGPVGASEATIEAAIPSGSTLVSVSDGGVPDADQVIWDLASLLPGSSGQVSYTVSTSGAGFYVSTAILQYLSGVTSKKVNSSQTVDIDHATPPETVFVGVPPNPTELTSASFALGSDQTPVTFQCSLDGTGYTACAAIFTLTGLSAGDHTLAARAVNRRGRIDPSPASYSWRIDAAPAAQNDSVTLSEDSAVTLIPVLANDSPGDAPTVIQAVSAPAHGGVQVSGEQIGYTPEPNFHGSDSFSYTIADRDGQTATATVDVTVVSVDDVPIAVEDATSVDEDGQISIAVLTNDTGLGDAPIAISGVTAPFHGSVVVVGDQLVYTPTPNYQGPELLSYTITDGDGETATAQVVIAVVSVNDAPLAVADAVATAEDSSGLEIDVLGNDTIADAPASLVEVTAAAHGSAELTTTGSVRYTPALDYFGADSFSYTVADVDGELATAVVQVTVSAVDDVPQAVDDAAIIDEDSEVTVGALGNDVGLGDAPVVISAVSTAAHGVASVVGAEVHYAPTADFHGVDSFTYTIEDLDGQLASATVTVTVVPVNDVPVAIDDAGSVDEDSVGNAFAVLSNDRVGDAPGSVSEVSDPSHGVAAVVGDLVVYSPDADFYGADSLSYTITDSDGQTATATVTISVASVNDTPVAVDDSAEVLGNATVLVPVLANDTRLGDAPVVVASISAPASGTAVIEGDAVRYTPNRYFTGVASFTYTLRDSDGDLATAAINIAVTSVNLTPVANDDTASVPEDGSVLIAVRANDSGGDEPVVLLQVSSPSHGTATVIGNEVRYTPNANYFGADSFTYTLRDEDGETVTAAVQVTVTPVNDTPVAAVDSFTVLEDSGATLFAVLANDTGLGDEPIAFVTFSDPPHGTVVVVGNRLQYTPDVNYNGTDSFTYRIRDLDNQQSASTVFVTVTNINDPPTAANDTFVVTAGVSTSLNVLFNDRDIDGNPLTLTSVSAPTVGTVAIVANQAVYLAPAGFVGAASFTYVVSDGRGGTGTATVTVDVR
jgi:uncharacterized repeat protein (TIGR01451 family)